MPVTVTPQAVLGQLCRRGEPHAGVTLATIDWDGPVLLSGCGTDALCPSEFGLWEPMRDLSRFPDNFPVETALGGDSTAPAVSGRSSCRHRRPQSAHGGGDDRGSLSGDREAVQFSRADARENCTGAVGVIGAIAAPLTAALDGPRP